MNVLSGQAARADATAGSRRIRIRRPWVLSARQGRTTGSMMNEHFRSYSSHRSRTDVAASDFDEVLAAGQDGASWAVAVLWNELHPRLLRFLRGA
jgi:hypothetical protein